jgi:hypothetical protein
LDVLRFSIGAYFDKFKRSEGGGCLLVNTFFAKVVVKLVDGDMIDCIEFDDGLYVDYFSSGGDVGFDCLAYLSRGFF